MQEPKPHHPHDCTHCTYLGSDEDKDFYYHHDEEAACMATFIARYGPHGDYSSGIEFCWSSVGLNEALKRAYNQGILTPEVIRHCKARQQEWLDYYSRHVDYSDAIDDRWKDRPRFLLP